MVEVIIPIGRGCVMKLSNLIISSYTCFGKTPINVDIDNLTGFIGHNSSGKNAIMSVLMKWFGEKTTDRIIERSDFYLFVNVEPSCHDDSIIVGSRHV